MQDSYHQQYWTTNVHGIMAPNISKEPIILKKAIIVHACWGPVSSRSLPAGDINRDLEPGDVGLLYSGVIGPLQVLNWHDHTEPRQGEPTLRDHSGPFGGL